MVNPMKTLAILALSTALAFGQSLPPYPTIGELVITELMANPGGVIAPGVTDEVGEYFEVCNIGSRIVDLQGCRFNDLTTTVPYQVTIPIPIQLMPGEFAVFIRNSQQAVAWGITAQTYAYVSASCAGTSCITVGGMNYGNTSDGVEFRDPNNNVLDAVGFGVLPATVPYATAFAGVPAPTGSYNGGSYERIDLLAPWSAANVAAATTIIPADPVYQNRGTPGRANSVDATRGRLLAASSLSITSPCGLVVLGTRWSLGNYALACSEALGAPIPLTTNRTFDLAFGPVFDFSITPGNPFFSGFGIGGLGLLGEAQALVNLPNDPGITGIPVYFQAVFFDAAFAVKDTSTVLQLVITN